LSRIFYRIAYGIGFKPWEQDADNLAPQLRRLLDREEAGRKPPFGPALDLGCGTGRWSIELAQRGWQVTGIDVVAKAIDDAQERGQEAGVDIRFVKGDVTALREAGIGSEFRFLLDIECFNHLNDEQRRVMGQEVTAVAAPEATMMLLAWRRARRGPLPPGANREDVQGAFDGWRMVGDEPYAGVLPAPLRGIRPRWYRLARP
jgi:SAM-dependent methyltransferase